MALATKYANIIQGTTVIEDRIIEANEDGTWPEQIVDARGRACILRGEDAEELYYLVQ